MRFDEIIGLVPRARYGLDRSPGAWLFALEIGFWIVVVLLAIAFIRFRPALIEKAEAKLRAISQHTQFWLVAFGVLTIVFRLSIVHWMPVPTPVIHDEFSYLLAADTFAHGRLTNPPSPMWQHFESFHINVKPTYQSMYPPAQGLALAAGQVLAGMPWAGVLLTMALMCSAIYWMLLGWLPAPWAWLGGAFIWLRFGIFSYWTNSYLGGAVAAIGGALVLGALPRLRSKLTVGTGLVLAGGLLILANSRPLEGFLFSLPIVIAALMIAIRNLKIDWRSTVKIAVPALGMLMVGGAWMLYYNWRGTGDPLLMPYVINMNEYHISKPFVFQKPNPIPEYRHQSMRALYVMHELPDLMRWKYDPGSLLLLKTNVYYGFFIWPFALLIIPCVYAMWKSEARIVLASLGLVAADLFLQIWYPEPHYVAPAVGALVLALLCGVRHFRNTRGSYAVWGTRALAIALAVWMLNPIADKLRDPFLMRPIQFQTPREEALSRMSPMPSMLQRENIKAELLARGGKHLVIIHYPWYDIPWQEWAYNDADMEHSPILWARDMGLEKNRELADYYSDRQVWYVDRADSPVIQLQPYERAEAAIRLEFEVPSYDATIRTESSKSTAPLGVVSRDRVVVPAALKK